MKLNKFKYWEQSDAGEQWTIEGLVFGQFNLVVGRNATGKTRLLRAIARAAASVSGEERGFSVNAKFEVVLPDVREDSELPNAKNATGEELARLRSEASAEWGRRLQYFPFAGAMNFKTRLRRDEFVRLSVAEAWKRGLQKPGSTLQAQVAQWLEDTGYKVQGIEVRSTSSGTLELGVQQPGHSLPTPLRRLSQGEQRTLTLLIFLALLVAEGKAATVLIDDFGEGLDFEHAGRFAEFLLKNSSRWALQFVIATNDRYVINAVPLEHWTILVDEGDKTQVFNYANSKQRFDNFKFTGLNNFDFFSMDFVRQQA